MCGPWRCGSLSSPCRGWGFITGGGCQSGEYPESDNVQRVSAQGSLKWRMGDVDESRREAGADRELTTANAGVNLVSPGESVDSRGRGCLC